LIHGIYQIGKAIHKNESAVEILLRKQNPVRENEITKKPTILIVEANVEDVDQIEFKCYFVDFIPNSLEKYLLGLTPGNSTNYSLSLSPSYKKINEEQRKNKKFSIKFDKMTKILKEKIDNKHVLDILKDKFPEETKWIKAILEKIERDPEPLFLKIEEFLDQKGMDKFDNPLLFKIRDNGGSKFLGEIPAMKELYEMIALPKSNKSFKNARCLICGSEENLQTGFDFGFFTLDQDGFRKLFFKNVPDLCYQYVMCRECYLLSLFGFLVLQNKLKFYAYSIKESRKTVPVYHYIIPTSDNLNLLKKDVETIAEAKLERDQKKKNQIQKQIQALNLQLLQVKQKRQKEKEKRAKKRYKEIENKYSNNIKKLKEQQEKEMGQFSIVEFFEAIQNKKRYIPIIDLYFKITDSKPTPKRKEIIAEIKMSSEHVSKLAELFNSVSQSLNRPLNLTFLQKIFKDNPKKFIFYYSSLLAFRVVNRVNFMKDIANRLKPEFTNHLISLSGHTSSGKSNYFRSHLNTFDTYNALYSKAGLWR